MSKLLRVTSGNFCGSHCLLVCDDKCNKAWGINHRPRTYFSQHLPEGDPDRDDDYAFLPDHEVGEAPANPGTYEGGHGKPRSDEAKHNKWCWRECERSEILDTAKKADLENIDFSKPVYNQPWKHQEPVSV